jgi:hypothetical protein
LIVTTSSGCSLSGDRAFGRAAADLGRVRAGLALERQPDECGKAVPHMRIREGDELRSILKRERAQLDVANRRIGGCYRFNEDLRAGLADGAPGEVPRPLSGSRQK